MKKFSELTTSEEISSLIDEKAFKHTNYYHYSDIEGIKGILNNKKLWISSMCFSNDCTEHNRFGDETYRYFQFCFSTGTTENLPLWFLYSGTNGNGARISFDKKVIKDLCDFKNINLELIDTNNDKKLEQLVPDKNCSVEFKDIIYRVKEGKKFRLKYNNHVNKNFSIDEMRKFEEKNPAFVKDIIWYYEKETRILIKVFSDKIKKELFENAEKSPYRIELTIPDNCYSNINLSLSPVYSKDNINLIDSIVQDEAVMSLNRSKILSKYAGQIKINLCGKCEKCDECDYKNYEEKICPNCEMGKTK